MIFHYGESCKYHLVSPHGWMNSRDYAEFIMGDFIIACPGPLLCSLAAVPHGSLAQPHIKIIKGGRIPWQAKSPLGSKSVGSTSFCLDRTSSGESHDKAPSEVSTRQEITFSLIANSCISATADELCAETSVNVLRTNWFLRSRWMGW